MLQLQYMVLHQSSTFVCHLHPKLQLCLSLQTLPLMYRVGRLLGRDHKRFMVCVTNSLDSSFFSTHNLFGSIRLLVRSSKQQPLGALSQSFCGGAAFPAAPDVLVNYGGDGAQPPALPTVLPRDPEEEDDLISISSDNGALLPV
jgi:hypothetical protein